MSKKVRWGVIGAGGIADRRTIPGMMKAGNAELIAVMEIDMKFAEDLKEKYSAKWAYDNVDDLLKNPDIDAVYIASPVEFHYDQAIKAARAKKHILLEKPMALTTELGKEIMAECESNGVKLAVGLMMRFGAYHQRMKEMIKDGALGQIVSARAQLTCWYPDMPDNWRQDPARGGGGALMDMGIHCIDILEYIIGSNISKLVAFTDTKTFKYKADDSSAVLFEMENGCTGFVDNNFNIPDAAAQSFLEVYGTKGSFIAKGTISQVDGGEVLAYLSDDELDYDAAQDRVDVEAVKIDVEFGDMYTRQIESFGRSILEDEPVLVPGDVGLRVQRLCELAYESSDTKKIIDV
ncbi:MAG: Gfo/Idh/MocA family oxidoreductase [Clostridiales bacterium]|nr:Gfo/Idh/MocA family oxidoreductase [Clostridiales bacterium]